MKTLLKTMGIGTAALLLGCGGGGGGSSPAPPGANRLTYVEPASTGWRFTKISGSGAFTDPMILELQGPPGNPVQGVACYLDLGGSLKVAWHPLSGSSYVDVLANPDLGLGSETLPRLVKDKLTLDELQVGVFRKTGSADPHGGVFRVALRLAGDAQDPGVVSATVRNTVVLDASGGTTSPAFSFGVVKAE